MSELTPAQRASMQLTAAILSRLLPLTAMSVSGCWTMDQEKAHKSDWVHWTLASPDTIT